MKSIIKSIFIIVSLATSYIASAGEGHDHSKHEKKKASHDDHKGHDDHGDEGKFGKGKAIIEVKEEGKHFKLSEEAIKTLKIDTVRLDPPTKGLFEVPSNAIIDFQDKTGVYRKKGQWIEIVIVKVVKRGKYGTLIESKDLAQNDQIVVNGVGLLRVAHLEASGEGGQGHVH